MKGISVYRLTNEAHAEAKVVPVYKPYRYDKDIKGRGDGVRLPYGFGADTAGMMRAFACAKEGVYKVIQCNEQVKADLGIEFKIEYIGYGTSEYDKDWYADKWRVTGKGDFSIVYHTGVGSRYYFYAERVAYMAFVVPPSAMDILYDVRMNDTHYQTFTDWCSEFGYNSDSIKHKGMFDACNELVRMFRRNYDVDLDDYEPLDNF